MHLNNWGESPSPVGASSGEELAAHHAWDTNPESTSTDVTFDTRMVEQLAALRAIASSYLRHERNDHTLTPTALVNEAYLRLHRNLTGKQSSRGAFIAAMANTIRRVLVDHARKRQAEKRGGRANRICLTTEILLDDHPKVDVIDLDEALNKLAQSNENRAKVVEMRFFAGLTEQETADALGLSHSSVQRLWRGTRAALAVLLQDYDEKQD